VGALPPIGRAALLLDLDGTLLDIAPTPDSVVVPPELPGVLRALRELLDDAVAVVTGRPVETIDRLLGDAVFAVAGEHGGAVRHAPGAALERPVLPEPPAVMIEDAKHLVAAHPGALFEPKARGFSLHYRAVPKAGEALREGLAALLAGEPAFELLQGSMIWEVRPRGAHKGTAVAELMERAPFAGRLPVFLGDDVTDEDGIAAAAAMGGAGIRVPEVFGDAAGVRAWLAGVAADRAWPHIEGLSLREA
jgi:trehalose 6-phosphate phosphatase